MINQELRLPADVPPHEQERFCANYERLTGGTNNCFIIAGDHRLEHLADDFIKPGIPDEAHTPEHMFRIASQIPDSVLATQRGFIAAYGATYSSVAYCVKVTGTTNLRRAVTTESLSTPLCTIDDVVTMRESCACTICAIGITCYFGSEHEAAMLSATGHMIAEAHRHGLVVIVWAYPRGKAVHDPFDPSVLAGVVGASAALGADFIKLECGRALPSAAQLRFITQAAGTSGVLLAGGMGHGERELCDRISTARAAGFRGCAVGRSIITKSLKEGVAFGTTIRTLVHKS